MKQAITKVGLAIVCAGGIAVTMQAEAANWLMLQGTEPSSAAARAKVWGFIQPTYLQTSGNELAKGPWAGQLPQFEGHQPDLSSSKTFQLMRARVGVRGTGMAIDPMVNYFIMWEGGNNGATKPGYGGGSLKLMDASITLNHIKGMRVRMGQMKTPMSEEIYQGIPTFNYVQMTNIANQQMIERPFWTDGNQSCVTNEYTTPAPASANMPVSNVNYLRFCNGDAAVQMRGNAVGVRDVGIQLFDSFNTGGWETSYAWLYGTGGTGMDNRSDKFDQTIYLSTEKVFKGEGARRDGMKFYVWQKKGKRTIYDSALLNTTGTSLTESEKEFDRNLQGLGMTFLSGPYRFWAELTKVDGMIFNGSTGGAVPGAVDNAGNIVAQFLVAPTGKGDGGYVDFGYKVMPNLELVLRYDWYNRLTNAGDDNGLGDLIKDTEERDYKTTTYGAQYFFNKKTKLIANYEVRKFESPNEAGTASSNLISAEMSNRINVQVTHIF